MGSGHEDMVMIIENKPRHYDITMSRRTRRPPLIKSEGETINSFMDSTIVSPTESELLVTSRKSLMQLISDQEGTNVKVEEGATGSLCQQEFVEAEKMLQIVVKKKENSNLHGIKVTKMVSHYVKILGHLMKKNGDSSKKKAIRRLSL